jgi:hypothetical protein
MRRAYEKRQILGRDGKLIAPEVAPKPRGPWVSPPVDPPKPKPRPVGLPWETLPLSGPVCLRCRAAVKLTWEGTRARRECPNGCFVATANYRTRQWEIEEPAANTTGDG